MPGNKDSGNHGRFGEDAPNWRGGQHVDSSGHMRVWVRERHRYVPRAHLVWLEAHPDDVVQKGYVIHHLDGDKLNDVIENLEKIPLAAHVARHRRPPGEYIKYLQAKLDAAGIDYLPQHKE
jgi:hypothetical protein